MPVGFSGWCFL